MQEIEAKVLEIDLEQVRAKLAELGAEQVFDNDVRSVYFDAPGMEEGDVLRLRQAGDKVFITMKEQVDHTKDSKVLEETEFAVDDFDAAMKLLTKLGKEVASFTKYRVKWKKGKVEYVVDRYEGIPPLLEIEAPTEEQVKDAFEELGYSWGETVDWDAREVFEHYGEE
jgi:predicted adenylyl cyclase CyaB